MLYHCGVVMLPVLTLCGMSSPSVHFSIRSIEELELNGDHHNLEYLEVLVK